MGQGGRTYPRATEDLMIRTLGNKTLTGKAICSLTGCNYDAVAARLASMFRKGILERNKNTPYRYGVRTSGID